MERLGSVIFLFCFRLNMVEFFGRILFIKGFFELLLFPVYILVNGKLYLSHLGKKGNEYLSHPTKPL